VTVPRSVLDQRPAELTARRDGDGIPDRCLLDWLAARMRRAVVLPHVSYLQNHHPPYVVPEPFNTAYDPAGVATFSSGEVAVGRARHRSPGR